jgi:hypothetical protein
MHVLLHEDLPKFYHISAVVSVPEKINTQAAAYRTGFFPNEKGRQ